MQVGNQFNTCGRQIIPDLPKRPLPKADLFLLLELKSQA
jgi:hypothetical protein